MEVQVKGLSLVHKQFLGRRASLWTKLGKTKPVKEISLTDTRAMVCTAGMDALSALGLQKDMLAKTKMVVRGFKRSMLTVLGAVAVEISAGGKTVHLMMYVTKVTKQLILARGGGRELPHQGCEWGGVNDIRSGESHSRSKGSMWMFRQI